MGPRSNITGVLIKWGQLDVETDMAAGRMPVNLKTEIRAMLLKLRKAEQC